MPLANQDASDLIVSQLQTAFDGYETATADDACEWCEEYLQAYERAFGPDGQAEPLAKVTAAVVGLADTDINFRQKLFTAIAQHIINMRAIARESEP